MNECDLMTPYHAQKQFPDKNWSYQQTIDLWNYAANLHIVDFLILSLVILSTTHTHITPDHKDIAGDVLVDLVSIKCLGSSVCKNLPPAIHKNPLKDYA